MARRKKVKMTDALSVMDNIVKESNKTAACYEGAFGHLTTNPLGGLKMLWKCIKGGK